MTTEPTPDASITVSARAASRTLRERRRRVWRSALTVVIVTAGMVILLIINRDNQTIRSCRERMEYALQELERLREEEGRAPRELPVAGESGLADDGATPAQQMRAHVYYNMLYAYSMEIGYGREIGVCCCKRPHTRLFLPNGRHVIVFNVERETFELHWMDEADFARRSEELGLKVPGAS